jgi:ribosome assembly protein 1
MEGVYLCNLISNPENYGIVYGLINKCRGKVVSEELQEGTNYFILDCILPLVESFVFTDQVRTKC